MLLFKSNAGSSIFCFSGLWNFTLLLLSTFFLISSCDKKVSVKEVIFDSAVEHIEWVGQNSSTMLCKTLSSRIYRSLDSGLNWQELTPILDDRDFKPKSIIVSPANKNYILMLGTGSTHYVSNDGASTFKLVQKQTGHAHSAIFHPTQPGYFLLSQWTSGCNKVSKSSKPDFCKHNLYVTYNLGQSFEHIGTYIIQFSWGDAKVPAQANKIYFSQFQMRFGSQPRTGGWSERAHFGYVKVKSTHFNLLVPKGNKFLISNGFMFVAKLIDEETQSVKLIVSTDNGKSFKETKFPEELFEHSYTILDTGHESVVIHVNHSENSSKTGGSENGVGNVYISDAQGVSYSLSLTSNVRGTNGICEFDEVAGMPGVYIANFRTDSHNSQNESLSDTENDDDTLFNDDEELSGDYMERIHKLLHHGKQSNRHRTKTVISFDKGASWTYLRAPLVDSLGNKINCRAYTGTINQRKPKTSPDSCSLHLHGITSFDEFAPFYSVESAVGLVIATGNVGTELTEDKDEINTYLSRNGGLTWMEAHKGAYIYEFGDHGGLIVMAKDNAKTQQIVFSWNEGQTWYDFDLGSDPIDVDNIVIEPTSKSVQFILYGTRGGSGVLFHLDFNSLGQPECRGAWAPDSVSSDYETWTPMNGRTKMSCINGQEITYTRRKATSECFNGEDFDRPIVKRDCTCTESDYECEYGFTRWIDSTKCVPQSDELSQEGCTSSAVFYASAYRKIPGNHCKGGWVPEKIPVLCPESSPFSLRAHFVLYTILLLMIVAAILTFCEQNTYFKSALHQLGFKDWSPMQYVMVGKSPPPATGFPMNDEEDEVLTFVKSAAAETHHHHSRLDDGDDDAPPLLDFSPVSPRDAYSGHSVEAVTLESVPKLQPPPSFRTQNKLI